MNYFIHIPNLAEYDAAMRLGSESPIFWRRHGFNVHAFYDEAAEVDIATLCPSEWIFVAADDKSPRDCSAFDLDNACAWCLRYAVEIWSSFG